jgi:pyruvate formate lyase activating enzyme
MIFDIQKYAIHDGPGIRTTVFFKGCPLRCWWCHNPEGQESGFELIYRRTRCIDCGACTLECPQQALSLTNRGISIRRGKCVACSRCSKTCPSDALSVVGREISIEEVMKEIEKDRIFYDESKGGVTFSGGEPLLQPKFLETLLGKCKDVGIHTAINTCGFASQHVFDRISNKVDLFLYDIKVMNNEKHRKYTGASNKTILENLKRLARNGSNVTVRFPIIPSINDDEENVVETAKFVSSLYTVAQINLLPYHAAAIEKYKNLDRTYKLSEVSPPSDQKMKWIKEEMEAYRLHARVGG